ncbi:MAG: potassium transporter TrkG [Pseudomonadota bacterium]
MRSRRYISQVGVEGALMVLSPLPYLFPIAKTELFDNKWQFASASIAVAACLLCAFTLFRKPAAGKIFGIIAAAGCYASAWPYIFKNPFIALTATVLLISAIFLLADFHIHFERNRKSDHVNRCGQRALWGISMVPLVIVVHLGTQNPGSFFPHFAVTASILTACILYMHWAFEKKSKTCILLAVTGFLLIVILYLINGFTAILSLVLFLSLCVLLSFPRHKEPFEKKEHWWEIFLSHPARILLTTFSGLCVVGTFLLSLPASTQSGSIKLVDACFTSVSAVCVTGLIVLDTPNDFTMFGQFCILLLIQLGGLGIMSITTVALHVMGRRLSLKHERVLTSMTDMDHKDLVHSLKTILKFTFIAEGIGAAVLFFLFLVEGDSAGMAAWRGVFSAISAFCNAGFALQSDSLIPYQTNALILHMVAALIIFGGMAPATSLLVPKWICGRTTPIPARIALITTVILLVSGTFFMMVFEWDGILSGLSVKDKIHNAWFQSVTLRTAGFNSVDIAAIMSPTFLIMLVFMFIGGSPGSTAGGVKTTTIGILAMTFWANITNKDDVVTQNRRIHSSTVYRAITIVVSGIAVWFMVVLMLQVTQQISAGKLIFEATSAIGTVGLSMGATSFLDEIGKIIIIIAMFAGRIGPMTLFMLLSEEQSISASRSLKTKISLT